jgi:hypothetical protein
MADLGEKRGRLRAVLDALKRLLGRRPAAPGDPYAYVTAPLRRGPKGRRGRPWLRLKTIPIVAFPRENEIAPE